MVNGCTSQKGRPLIKEGTSSDVMHSAAFLSTMEHFDRYLGCWKESYSLCGQGMNIATRETKAGADWWTWVQFVVLCVSTVVNVVPWVRTQWLDSAMCIAEYNDQAWGSRREFDKDVQG
jgi:hypothetical protein